MSAPIPTPTRARPRLNLMRLMHDTPNVSAIEVQAALERVFPRVVAEYNCDPFYTFRIRCGDEDGRTRLRVVFGWSRRRDCWVFETLKGDPR